MDNKNLTTKALMTVLTLMFLGGIALGAVDLLSVEGQEPPEERYKQSLTQLPEGKEAVVQYLNTCVENAKTGQAKLDVSTKISVDDKSVSFGDNGELFQESFIYAKESLLENLLSRYPKKSVDFGQDFTGELWNLQFEPAVIDRTESKEDKEQYNFKIVFPDEANPFGMNGVVNESFHMADSQDFLNYLWVSYKDLADIRAVQVTCTGMQIESDVNRLTDQIGHITYVKMLNVQAEITFLGELSAAGSRTMTFTLAERTSFHFTWAGLSLSPKALELKKGDIKVIGAYMTASGDRQVLWSSSNPAVASVDSEGYVKARQVSAQPVVITAEFEFLGKKYTDSCEVYVTVPVTKVKLSEKKINLKAGQTQTLEASVKPDDATIKDVTWTSRNPAVAAVDSSGNITGMTAGETEIVVLSKDGYYKITCTVTVVN